VITISCTRAIRLILFGLAALAVRGQQASPQTARPQATAQSSGQEKQNLAIDLLQRSHDVGRQLPLYARLSLLPRQIRLVSQWSPNLALEWANEMFTVSLEVKGKGRLAAESNAISMLARLDPDRALGLLHSTIAEESADKSLDATWKHKAALSVFTAFAERDGEAALPMLEREAENLAAGGRYPYSAMGFALSQMVQKGWRDNRPQAISMIQKFLDGACARYDLGVRGYQEDLEFGHMLRAVAGYLPPESARPAVRLLVKNLLATDITKNQYRAEEVTQDGQIEKTDNAIDSALVLFGSMIARNDPELAQELQSTRPQLKNWLRPSFMIMRPVTSRPPDPVEELRLEAIRLTHRNFDGAIAKARQLPKGSVRAATLLDIARDIAGDHPEQAGKLIAEAQPHGEAAGDSLRLRAIVAQVSLTAAQGKAAELRELLRQGFDLATRIAWRDEGKKDGTIPGCGALVQFGAQNEPQMTVIFILGLPQSPSLRAELLLVAATAVGMDRLPLRSARHQ
jgi:hypothetical protein